MPFSHSASPARVPNFSYDSGERDLTLLDSTVQKDMARTKRIIGGGAAARSPRPYAVDTMKGEPAPLRCSRRVVPTKASTDWVPQHAATRRTNHLQNAPSAVREPKMRASSRVNDDSDPLCRRTTSRSPASVQRSRINEDSNIFGPPLPAYRKPPPPPRQSFVQKHRPGHIRPTLPGQTDACKFSSGGAGTKFY